MKRHKFKFTPPAHLPKIDNATLLKIESGSLDGLTWGELRSIACELRLRREHDA